MGFNSQIPVITARKSKITNGSQVSPGDGDSSVANLKVLLQRTLLNCTCEGHSERWQQHKEQISYLEELHAEVAGWQSSIAVPGAAIPQGSHPASGCPFSKHELN